MRVLNLSFALEEHAFADEVRRVLGNAVLSGAALRGERRFEVHLGTQALLEAPASGAGCQIQEFQTSQGPLHLALTDRGWTLLDAQVSCSVWTGGARLCFAPEPTPVQVLAHHLALTEVARAAAMLPLHAAVLSRNGRAVALFGESGAGKSTAALRLMSRGWRLVTEDSAWLHLPSGVVCGAGTGLRVWQSSVERFAPQLGYDWTKDAQGKLALPAEVQPSAALERVYLLTSQPRPALSAVEQVRGWWSATGLPVTALARQQVAQQVHAAWQRYGLQGLERGALVEALGELERGPSS